jgi:hypothetical protein
MKDEEIPYPIDFDAIVQGGRRAFSAIGLRNDGQNLIQKMLTRIHHWRVLNDSLEHARLNDAIMFHVYNR